MAANDHAQYYGLILRVFLGLTVLFWGYEKLVIEKLTQSYTMVATLGNSLMLLKNDYISARILYI